MSPDAAAVLVAASLLVLLAISLVFGFTREEPEHGMPIVLAAFVLSLFSWFALSDLHDVAVGKAKYEFNGSYYERVSTLKERK